MPAVVTIVCQIDGGKSAKRGETATTIVAYLELQTGAVVHLAEVVDVRHPEREQIADAGLDTQA